MNSVSIIKSFKTIPIIDVSPLVSRNSCKERKKETAQRLDQACKDGGFFYVKNHGIPKEIYKNVLRTARDFFQLPENTKNKIQLSPETHYRGYQSTGINITKMNKRYNKDEHEAIDLYREVDPENFKSYGYSESALHGMNPWPMQPLHFTNELKLYSESMKKLGFQIIKGIAMGLGLDENYFTHITNDPYWYIRIIYYPSLIKAADSSGINKDDIDFKNLKLIDGEFIKNVNISCGEHTDYGLLTLVNQDEHVRNANGEWIDAEPIRDTFVCNIGDMFKILTNGRYEPALHRVINIDNTSRISIPFFYEPNFSSVIQPVEKFCTNDVPCKFKPIKYQKHLENKVFNNFCFNDI